MYLLKNLHIPSRIQQDKLTALTLYLKLRECWSQSSHVASNETLPLMLLDLWSGSRALTIQELDTCSPEIDAKL